VGQDDPGVLIFVRILWSVKLATAPMKFERCLRYRLHF